MKNSKKQLGQFYTTNSEYITQNLLEVFPKNAIIVDTFVGEGDLIKLVSNETEYYDIDPKIEGTIERDSLLNPIDYTGKWVFTNPPYLAKNKNKDKTIYEKYDTDDLYKASLITILGCEGGVIILPLNFFSSDNGDIRDIFLSKYEVIKVNVFEETVFEDTSYTICAFSFIKKDNIEQTVNFTFFPSKEELNIKLLKSSKYKIGSEIYELKQSTTKIGRLTLGNPKPNSKIFLKAIDTGTEEGMLGLSISEEAFYGKNTDRAFATIIFDRDFTEEEQAFLVEEFNKKIAKYRQKYRSMFLTNYRNSTKILARKRISFRLVYSILSNIILENFE